MEASPVRDLRPLLEHQHCILASLLALPRNKRSDLSWVTGRNSDNGAPARLEWSQHSLRARPCRCHVEPR